MDYSYKKENFFQKSITSVSSIFSKKENFEDKTIEDTIVKQSTFDYLISDLTEADVGFKEAKEASILLDQSLTNSRKKTQLVAKLENIENKLEEVECFAQLNEEDGIKLKKMLDNFVALKKERNSLIYQVASFDKNLNDMETLHKDAIKFLKQIEEAEEKQRLLRYDIGQLKGEKESLEDEYHMLEVALNFVDKFNIVMVGILVFAIITLGYLSMFANKAIFLPTTICIMFSIILLAAIKYFKQRISFELKMNRRRQDKAIKLLNKKNVVYLHYSNFLKFSYNKYKASNSIVLKENIKDYTHYKFLTNRIDSIRKIFKDTENSIQNFLIDKNISKIKINIEEFSRTINIGDQVEYYKTLEIEKVKIESLLEEIDSNQTQIWSKIESLNEYDLSDEKIINVLIKYYENELSKIFQNFDYYEYDDIDIEAEAV